MIFFLDFKIFGNGRGLAQPYWSGIYYWLVDQHTKHGEFYTFFGGYGAQLESIQWTHPKAQEERMFHGMRFRPFWSTRRWFRVRVSWACTEKQTNESLRVMESKLGHN